jgi:hypothetical protein
MLALLPLMHFHPGLYLSKRPFKTPIFEPVVAVAVKLGFPGLRSPKVGNSTMTRNVHKSWGLSTVCPVQYNRLHDMTDFLRTHCAGLRGKDSSPYLHRP